MAIRTVKREGPRAEQEVARFLTWAWTQTEHGSRGDPKELGPSPIVIHDWEAALVHFMAEAALAGAADVPAGAENREARVEAREIWREVLGVTEAPDESEATSWAARVAATVVPTWRKKKGLKPLLLQLNRNDQRNLLREIALSGQDIAQSLRQLIKVTAPLTLAGGGGVALAVLFVDKG